MTHKQLKKIANAVVPVETPEVTTDFLSALDAGGTLRARAAFWLPLLALFSARVRLNCGAHCGQVETERETHTPLLFVPKRTSSHCLKKVACTWSIMKIRNASVERSLFAGTLIRLVRSGAEEESSCIALDW
jgi:hypothetical protein